MIASLVSQVNRVQSKMITLPSLQPALNKSADQLLRPSPSFPQPLLAERRLESIPNGASVDEGALLLDGRRKVGGDVLGVLEGEEKRVDSGTVGAEDLLLDTADGGDCD